jgi:hypothetical protein
MPKGSEYQPSSATPPPKSRLAIQRGYIGCRQGPSPASDTFWRLLDLRALRGTAHGRRWTEGSEPIEDEHEALLGGTRLLFGESESQPEVGSGPRVTSTEDRAPMFRQHKSGTVDIFSSVDLDPIKSGGHSTEELSIVVRRTPWSTTGNSGGDAQLGPAISPHLTRNRHRHQPGPDQTRSTRLKSFA